MTTVTTATPKDVARLFGVSVRTVFRWSAAGKLTAHKISQRVVRFDASEVEKLWRESKVL